MKYIGYFDTGNEERRNVAVATKDKMSYIIKALTENDENVEVVSISEVLSDSAHKGKYVKLDSKSTLKTFYSIGKKNRVIGYIDKVFIRLQFLIYMLRNTKPFENVLVYHSTGLIGVIKILSRIKKIRLILEVEEIYADVNGNKKLREKELKFFKSADAYIFPTQLMNNIININHKPSIIIHGTYKAECQREKLFNDGKIHVVYAGTFDPRKGGVVAAAAATEFLPEKYHIHILGSAPNFVINNFKKTLSAINSKSKATVTYEGLLLGEEYIRFLQSCDIGLSTQNPDAVFNATSFPSKILSYMSNGLRVVSIRIPAIETSAIGKYMYYYNEQSPEAVAEAIISVNINDDYNGREIISKLDLQFKKDLKLLLEDK